MSIMDIFRTQAATGPAKVAPPSNQNPGGNSPNNQQLTQQNSNTAPNGVVPKTEPEGNQNSQKEPESPLSQFSELWNNPVSEDGKEPEVFSAVVPLDAAKLQEQVKNLDFAKVVGAENLKKIIAGGEDAATALMSSLNAVAQTVFTQSALSANKLVEKALERQATKFHEDLPGIIKKHSLGDSLQDENPMFSNPAVKPIIDAIQERIAIKNPSASESQLRKLTKEYLKGVGMTFAPQTEGDSQTPKNSKMKKPDETDWSTFLS